MKATELLTAGVLESAELWATLLPLSPDDVTLRPAPSWMRGVWASDVAAMTIGTTTFVDPDFLERATPNAVSRLVVHELIHARQWQEVGPLAFLFGYVKEYLISRADGQTHAEAYRNVSFEVAARQAAAAIR